MAYVPTRRRVFESTSVVSPQRPRPRGAWRHRV